MHCACAKPSDENHGWACEITGDGCMFPHPDSKLCAAMFGEGPEADTIAAENAGVAALIAEDPTRKFNFICT